MSNIEGMKLLEDAIVKARANKNPEDKMSPISALIEMYKNDAWIILPCFKRDDGGYGFDLFNVPDHKEFGNLLVVFTDMKYFNNVFGNSVINVSIRKVIELMNSFQDECNGLLINPATHDVELVMFKDGINRVIEASK